MTTVATALLLVLLATSLAACGAPQATDLPAATSSPSAVLPTLPPTSPQTATSTLAPTVPASPTAAPVDSPTFTETHTPAPAATTTPRYTYNIIHTYPHDREAYTQGLIFVDGIFYESTGLRGASTLRKVAVETGEVLQIYALPDQYFGEGLTLFGDRLIQLTWQSQIGFVYDRDSFALLDTFSYPTQGWGLTHDTQHLIMSDGSATLHFLDPQTFAERRQVQVYDENGPVARLNELEYIDGQVYANVYQTDRVARIDPQSGRISAWIDLAGLLQPEDLNPPVDVLNGIAYDPGGDRLFVTGKLWPKLFEIELVPQAKSYLPFVQESPASEPVTLAAR
jgi:glutamine cyclotransferase